MRLQLKELGERLDALLTLVEAEVMLPSVGVAEREELRAARMELTLALFHLRRAWPCIIGACRRAAARGVSQAKEVKTDDT